MQYATGDEDTCFGGGLERLQTIELERLLQFHRQRGLDVGRKIAAAFTAAVTSDFPLDSESSEDCEASEYDSSSYGTEENDSVDDEEESYDGESDCTCEEHQSGGTTNESDSTFIEDDDTDSGGETDSASSIVDEDVQIILKRFHGLMEKVLEHNSAACLIQFLLDQRGGKGDDGPSITRATLPWHLVRKVNSEWNGPFAELENLSLEDLS